MKISNWYQGHQAPAVLMIDDLNDVYIDIYKERYKNDWGYLLDADDSAYTFLKKNLLALYPEIKITFFVPYLRHATVNESIKNYKKFAIGEREEFSSFVKGIIKEGHEVAHHGSNHGAYGDESNLSTVDNFKHEWELFENVEEAVEIVNEGKDVFKKHLDYEITGGKFCGYMKRENSLEIIDKSDFEYWSVSINMNTKEYDYTMFGQNKVIDFPTNFNGNAFVRLIYKRGVPSKDFIKLFTRFLQPLYNIKVYKELDTLIDNGHIISILEHIAPSMSSGEVQASNIASDMKSLQKIYHYLSSKSIWHATCKDIARYIYVKENSQLTFVGNKVEIEFNNTKNLNETFISIEMNSHFKLTDKEGKEYSAIRNTEMYVVSLKLFDGKNIYDFTQDLK